MDLIDTSERPEIPPTQINHFPSREDIEDSYQEALTYLTKEMGRYENSFNLNWRDYYKAIGEPMPEKRLSNKLIDLMAMAIAEASQILKLPHVPKIHIHDDKFSQESSGFAAGEISEDTIHASFHFDVLSEIDEYFKTADKLKNLFISYKDRAKRTIGEEIFHIMTAYYYPDIWEASREANTLGDEAYEQDLGENLAHEFADNYARGSDL